MAQSVQCLPWKHGDLNSIPRTHVKKYECGGNLCNLKPGEMSPGSLCSSLAANLAFLVSSTSVEDPDLKNEVLCEWGMTPEVVSWPLHECLYICVFTCKYMCAHTRSSPYTHVTACIHIQRRRTVSVLSRYRLSPIIFSNQHATTICQDLYFTTYSEQCKDD